mmetsp:Transcript_78549/g.243675  ORF Transcript_78549/g.243675 Transcript_78549/m.243675 type:complete len:268 (-) Transcript_78549:549-1352(-)
MDLVDCPLCTMVPEPNTRGEGRHCRQGQGREEPRGEGRQNEVLLPPPQLADVEGADADGRRGADLPPLLVSTPESPLPVRNEPRGGPHDGAAEDDPIHRAMLPQGRGEEVWQYGAASHRAPCVVDGGGGARPRPPAQNSQGGREGPALEAEVAARVLVQPLQRNGRCAAAGPLREEAPGLQAREGEQQAHAYRGADRPAGPPARPAGRLRQRRPCRRKLQRRRCGQRPPALRESGAAVQRQEEREGEEGGGAPEEGDDSDYVGQDLE